MTRLLEWLLGLENIRLDRDAPLLIKWEALLPAWMLFAFVLLTLVVLVLVYRRERGTVARRTALGALRLTLFLLVLLVLCRPALVLQRNRVEPAHVALVVDRSLSMATHDTYDGEPALAEAVARGAGLADAADIANHSRLELVSAALLKDDGAALRALARHNALQLSAFAAQWESLGYAPNAEAVGAIAELLAHIDARGTRTDLALALLQAVERAQGRRVAAIVLASDGQATEPADLRDAIDLVRGRQIPVLALRIGSEQDRVDVEVGLVRAQETVFVHDLLSVEGQLSVSGAAAATLVSVRLVDERSGEVVATREVVLDPAAASTAVELRTKPARAGRIRYRFEALPLPEEHTLDNNADVVDVVVLEDRVRVLYVEGYPRYEYRYLKNALLREKTVELSVLLQEADEQFVQEGTFPIRRFPESPEELQRFDVVMFGDVDPRGGWLSSAQMTMLLDYVGHTGGGFAVIAGERCVPLRFLGTPLERLLPVRMDPQFFGTFEGTLHRGFGLRMTPEGRRSRLFRGLASDSESSLSTDEHAFAALPELYWFARTLGPRPGATVLAAHPTVNLPGDAAGGDATMPLIVTGRYGAGKLFFQATDETWRWRRHTGELLHDTYWVQVVRELMRGGRLAQDRRWSIRPDRRVYDYGKPVRLTVEIEDAALLAERQETLGLVVAERSGDLNAARGASETGGGLSARLTAYRLAPDSHRFEATWVPDHPGTFVVQAEGLAPLTGESPPSAAFRVQKPDLESRRPEADHTTLERIAEQTGGKLVELDQLTEAFHAIRDRSVQIPDDVTEPLWDSRLVLILFLAVISTEWVLRKAFGLL